MFSLKELQRRFDAYKDDRISRVEFRDWFEANSYDAYEDVVLRPVCVAIDTAFSEYLFDDIGEDALKQELANAIRPFALQLYWSEDAIAHKAPSYALSTSSEVRLFEVGAVSRYALADTRGYAVGDLADADAKEPLKKLAASARSSSLVEAIA